MYIRRCGIVTSVNLSFLFIVHVEYYVERWQLPLLLLLLVTLLFFKYIFI